MNAIRKIINSDELISVIDIPTSFRNRPVELIILPVEERTRVQDQEQAKSAYGILNKYANPDLIAFEDGAWEEAVKEKYALR